MTAADQVNERLRVLRERGATAAPRSAVKAMSLLGVAAVQLELSKSTHSKGEKAGPAGEPPSVVSGALRRSIIATPPVATGTATYLASVGGTIIYARIHEFGGVIHPLNARMLRWTDASGSHFAKEVTIPARPYLRPAMDRLFASGKLSQVAAQSFLKALE